jgi:hypothetical protein
MVAFLVDLVIGLAALLGFSALSNALASSGVTQGFVAPVVLGAIWLALLLAFARRGRTPGQAALGLTLVTQEGTSAGWRAVGDLGFWCAALFVLVGPGLLLVVLNPASIGDSFTNWTLQVAAYFVAVGAIALAAHGLARRRPTCLVHMRR